VGVFDPYGVADALNATLQVGRGDYLDATISAIGIIPYLGDVAKGAKISKDIRLIEESITASGIKQADKNLQNHHFITNKHSHFL